MSHGLLINEPPLQVLPSLAQIIGLNEAIVLQQIHYWLSRKHNKNHFDGRYWVYNTYEQWEEQFPFWSLRTIQRTIYNLENLNLIISFFQNSADKTKYYTVNYDVLDEIHRKAICSNTSTTQDTKSLTPQNGLKPHLVNMTKDPRQYDEGPSSIWQPTLVNMTKVYIDTETTTETTTERVENLESAERSMIVPPGNSPPIKEVKKKKKGTSLSDDWVLPVEWRDWAMERGMMLTEIDRAEVKFKNYWLSTTKNAIKMDWFRTWQNWCLGECERKGIRFNVKSTPPKEIQSTRGFATRAETLANKPSSDPRIQKWYDLQDKLSKQVGDNEYNSWLADLELIDINDNAVFKAKNSFVRDYVNQRFIGEICACLGKIDSKLSSREKVKFVVAVNPLRRGLIAS